MCSAALDTVRIPVPYPCDFFIGSHLDLVGIKNKSFLSKKSSLLKDSHSQTNPGADIYQNSFRPEVTISDAQERCQQRKGGPSPRLVSPLKSKDNKIPQGLKPYRSERNSKCKPFLCVYEYKLPGWAPISLYSHLLPKIWLALRSKIKYSIWHYNYLSKIDFKNNQDIFILLLTPKSHMFTLLCIIKILRNDIFSKWSH